MNIIPEKNKSDLLKALDSLCKMIPIYDMDDRDFAATVLHKMAGIVREHGPSHGVNLVSICPDKMILGDYELKQNEQGNLSFSKVANNNRLEVDLRNLIEKVIYNPPATIIFWKDGQKTVVKGSDADYDHNRICPELGIVHAIAKRALGNKGNYSTVIKRLVKSTEPKEENKK